MYKINSIFLKVNKINRSKLIFGLVFGFGIFLVYFVFCVLPIFDSIKTSFYDWSGYGVKTYIGIKNYLDILKDPVFLKAIKNDFGIALIKEIIIVVFTMIFAISLTRLNITKVEIAFFRFVFFIPNILSVIVIGIIWRFFFSTVEGIGLFNGIIKLINKNFEFIPWIGKYPVITIGFVASWCGIGLFMLIMISAINQINEDLYEASKVDGANEWVQLLKITLPCIWNQVSFMIVTILFQTLGGNFALVFALRPSGGVVDNPAVVMGLYVYNYSFDASVTPRPAYSYASAITMLIITAVVSFIVYYLLKRKDEND